MRAMTTPHGLGYRKMIIDATTPVEPDTRGHYSRPVRDLPETGEWITRLQDCWAGPPTSGRSGTRAHWRAVRGRQETWGR